MEHTGSLLFRDSAEADGKALLAVQSLIDGVIGMVDMARCLVRMKRRVELNGLEQAVGLLCARALDLEPSQGRTLRRKLGRVMRILEALREDLTRAEAPDVPVPRHMMS